MSEKQDREYSFSFFFSPEHSPHKLLWKLPLIALVSSWFLKKLNLVDTQVSNPNLPSSTSTHTCAEKTSADFTSWLGSGVCFRSCYIFCSNPGVLTGKFPLQGEGLKYPVFQGHKQFTWNVRFPTRLRHNVQA